MKKHISIFILLHFAVTTFCQMPVSELSKKTHARQLKEGVLLIQLPNSDKKIEILKANGQNKLAQKEQEEVEKIREKLIVGFKEEWDVSEILFFETEHTQKVFNKDYTFMLDRELNPLKELPKFEHYYSVRYGPGNPNGEVYRYNGDGLQIRYLKNGKLQTIKYDTFFNSEGSVSAFKDFFRNLFKSKKANLGFIAYLNLKIKNVKS